MQTEIQLNKNFTKKKVLKTEKNYIKHFENFASFKLQKLNFNLNN